MAPIESQDHSSLLELVAVIQYRYVALRDNALHSLFLLSLAVGLLVLVWYWAGHPLFVVILSILVFWSLRSLFVPVVCVFSLDGIKTAYFGHVRFFAWNDIRFFRMTPFGVQLRVTPHWFPLLVFKTPFVPVPKSFRADVLAVLREMIPEKELL